MNRVARENVIDLRKDKSVLPVNIAEKKNLKNADKIPPTKETGILYEWDAPEFTTYKKDASWYAILAIATVALTIFFLITENYLGMIVILILAALVYMYSRREPRTIHFAISPLGVEINTSLHPFEEIRSFWIFYEPGEIKELSFRTKKLFTPYLGLPLGKADPIALRQILLKFVLEQKQEEPVANILARRLKF